MWKTRAVALGLLLIGAFLGWFVYTSHLNLTKPFRLGLDLSGGTQLIYRADTSSVVGGDVREAMNSLRDTIERRVNLFGVAEPIVQTERGGTLAGQTEERLIVELPGVTDTEAAIKMIGQTPTLEFRLMREGVEPNASSTPNDLFFPAAVTGKHVARAELQFGNGSGLSNEPVVVLHFNSEGKQLFADLTGKNVGKVFGIFLDGSPISTPVIREAIPDGTAVISGNFRAEEAKELVRNLNFGALPLAIELRTTETVGSTLGEEAVYAGVAAGFWGLIAVIIFMVLWYRLPGLIAGIALALYVVVMLALFQWIPVTLTAAGIAAFILSIGMAVDANILIFERTREEFEGGKNLHDAIHDGFNRAWLSIRDSNASSMITAVILFWFGTSIVQGFALVFGLGVLVSMLTAITVSRTLLLAMGVSDGRVSRTLFGSGFKI